MNEINYNYFIVYISLRSKTNISLLLINSVYFFFYIKFKVNKKII